MNEKLSISFGALAPPLHKQLQTSETRMRIYQRMADGLTACAIHRVLSESEVAKARGKLARAIAASMKKP